MHGGLADPRSLLVSVSVSLVSLALARGSGDTSSGSQSNPPTCLATSRRMVSMRCWYRLAIAALDHPMIAIAVEVGTPRISKTVAAV